jgi:hypothetical protein
VSGGGPGAGRGFSVRRGRPTVLPFVDPGREAGQLVGRVHPDGSISFRGRTYRTIKEVPADCLGLRADVAAYTEWRRLYRAVMPREMRDEELAGSPPNRTG